MWMVDPKIMCRQHLLGEHVEHHMFMGTIKKKKNLQGYVDNNLFEYLSLVNRHKELVFEMLNRGFKHNSELIVYDGSYLNNKIWNSKVDRIKSLKELLDRCSECRQRYMEKQNGKNK